MSGNNNVHSNKIHNIIAHFLVVYDDAEQFKENNALIANVFIYVTLSERLFDEKRKIVESLPQPNQEVLLKNSIEQLCELKTRESIHNFIQIMANLDSVKYRVEIPYDDITSFIYNFKGAISIEAVNERLNEFSRSLKDSLVSEDTNNALKVEKVYKKFERHIKLAISQRCYIDEVTSKSSKDAKKIADFANQAAQDAERLAKEADAQAKSTIANYISILGIFASIIFTLFGGVNLIGSTVKLLETSSRLPYLVFIVSLLMICLLTLLNMMVKWVNSMSNLKNILENHKNSTNPNPQPSHSWWKVWQGDFYTKAVSIFLMMALLSLIGMYCIKKEHFFSFTEEVTSEVKEPKGIISALDKPASEVESATEKPKGDVTSNTTDNDENNNKDVKVVKTFTFSNHPASSNDDKKEDE